MRRYSEKRKTTRMLASLFLASAILGLLRGIICLKRRQRLRPDWSSILSLHITSHAFFSRHLTLLFLLSWLRAISFVGHTTVIMIILDQPS